MVGLRGLGVVCSFVGGVAALSGSAPAAADDPTPVNAAKAPVQIIEGPEVERTTDTSAIIRWTATKRPGTSLRYGVVHYGTDLHALSQTAKSPNRWNPALPSITYRVQMNRLKPGTTYYYRVESADAFDVAEGPESPVSQFTTEQSP
jgi:phosphodiesterase/alkaline phosphatase D-like protein